MGEPDAEAGIVVLGAGYGGLRAALTLARLHAARSALPITLIDQGATHQLITEIHRVATGHLPAHASGLPLAALLRGTGITFRQATVTGLDVERRLVRLQDGAIPYTYLVVALGSQVEDHGVPGARQWALGLKSVADAQLLWQRLQTTIGPDGPDQGEAARTVVVVGAGWTGTELAGELTSLAARLVAPPRIVVLEAGPAVLPSYSSRLAAAACDFLRDSGVDLRLNARVAAVHQGGVALQDGREIAAATVIWTGGVRGVLALAGTALPLDASGRVRVDPYLRAIGYPTVFVVGDAAHASSDSGPTPGPSAQLALSQGEIAAANVAAALSGRAPLPYRPHLLGEALSLGQHDGAATVGPLLLRGRAALKLKRAIALNYVRSLGGSAAALEALGHGL